MLCHLRIAMKRLGGKEPVQVREAEGKRTVQSFEHETFLGDPRTFPLPELVLPFPHEHQMHVLGEHQVVRNGVVDRGSDRGSLLQTLGCGLLVKVVEHELERAADGSQGVRRQEAARGPGPVLKGRLGHTAWGHSKNALEVEGKKVQPLFVGPET